MASKFARGAGLIALSQGLGKVSNIFTQSLKDKEERERNQPFRNLQMKSMQQQITKGEEEEVKRAKARELSQKFVELMNELNADVQVKEEFDKQVEAGAEQLMGKGKEQAAGQARAQAPVRGMRGVPLTSETPQAQITPPPAPVQPSVPVEPQMRPRTAQEKLGMLQGSPEFAQLPEYQKEIGKYEGIVSKGEEREYQGKVREEGYKEAGKRQQAGFTQQDKVQHAGFGQQDKMAKMKQRFELNKIKSAADAIVGADVDKPNFKTANLEIKLANQVKSDKRVVDFGVIDQQFSRMQAVWDDYTKGPKDGKSMIGVDQALIMIFNKMLDPTSVVRESEFARTPQAMAIIERLKGLVPKLERGGVGLTDKDRQEVVDVANTLYDTASDGYSKLIDNYTTAFSDYEGLGVKAERVMKAFDIKITEASKQKEEEEIEPGTRDYGQEYNF